ncbi:MAG: LysM peptidoglycan-binding domain-containing protein [Proteobacteria bacterium]|nr:MAG: LysM peptidoglycan-binding domain-containing protein [Pseudomonadota bacterium]
MEGLIGMMKRTCLGLVACFFLSACATVPAQNTAEDAQGREVAAAKKGAQAAADLESPAEIEKILEETNPVLSESNGENEKVPLHIPIEINRKVSEWINFFTVRERERTLRYLERGEALRPHIEQMLKENEVPPELYYLAMIESGFVTHAKSHAKAVGIWQFMPGTGRNYGLAVNAQVDERRNWIKSTEAAASYLKDLNNVFGSWYLALAAYNAGEHRIVRSIMKGKTRDFWALAEQGLLPKETLNYVPKFLAAHIVGKNMKRFGFDPRVQPEDRWEPFETVSVPSGVKLTDVSRVTGTDLENLKKWNRDLIKGVTGASKTGSTVDIYIPHDDLAKFEAKKEGVLALKRYKTSGADQRIFASGKGNKESSSSSHDIYIVRRGDNLSAISKKIGVSARTLMKVNGLRRGRIHPGQRLKFYSPTAKREEGERNLASTKPKKSRKKK